MMIRDLSTQFETHRVITYNFTRDKAVYHNVEMRQAKGCIYIGEPKPDEYGRNYCVTYAYFADKGIGIAMGTYADDADLQWVLNDAAYHHLDRDWPVYLIHAKQAIDAGYWFTVLEVELLKNIAPELVDGANEARRIHKERSEAKRRAEEQKRQEEDALYVKEQNEQAFKLIDKAIETIKRGGVLNNNTVEIYKERYDSKDYCVVGYLMDKYGVSLPIRTRGWVNNSLARITVSEGGEVTRCQYRPNGKSKGSTAVWKYLDQLIKAIRTEESEG